MRWLVVSLWSGALLAATAGCRTNCAEQVLESELRARDFAVRDLRAALVTTQAQNVSLQRELCDLRQGGLAAKVTPELASQIYTVQEIVLGRQTGGYDDDGLPGDELLQVVLEPRDPDKHTLKAPGSAVVQAIEVNPQGLKRPLCQWDISPEELRRSWRTGLLSTGYFLKLPWKVPPTSDKLRVVVQFILADGRAFEADKDVTLRLPPGEIPKVIPPGPPPAPEELPAPRTTGPITRHSEPEPTPAAGAVKDQPTHPVSLWEAPRPTPVAPAKESGPANRPRVIASTSKKPAAR